MRLAATSTAAPIAYCASPRISAKEHSTIHRRRTDEKCGSTSQAAADTYYRSEHGRWRRYEWEEKRPIHTERFLEAIENAAECTQGSAERARARACVVWGTEWCFHIVRNTRGFCENCSHECVLEYGFFWWLQDDSSPQHAAACTRALEPSAAALVLQIPARAHIAHVLRDPTRLRPRNTA